MKAFLFDGRGNLTVSEFVTQSGMGDGDEVLSTSQVVSAGQLERHLPMFEADMSADELKQAQAIIAGLNV